MKTIPHRELRNDSSRVLAAVKAGETIAVTNRGEVTALLVPPGTSRYEQLVVSGAIIPASSPGHARDITRVSSAERSMDVLDDLRDDR